MRGFPVDKTMCQLVQHGSLIDLTTGTEGRELQLLEDVGSVGVWGKVLGNASSSSALGAFNEVGESLLMRVPDWGSIL